MDMDTQKVQNYKEFFYKNRNLVFAVLRATSLIAEHILGLDFEKKIDEKILKEYTLDCSKVDCKGFKRLNIVICMRILDKYT